MRYEHYYSQPLFLIKIAFKASTVHALITETGESKDGSQSSHPEAPDALNHCQKPTIAQTLSDVVVKCGETFSLTTKIENADDVIWTLEGEEILAEPDEGLILKAEGKILLQINNLRIFF